MCFYATLCLMPASSVIFCFHVLEVIELANVLWCVYNHLIKGLYLKKKKTNKKPPQQIIRLQANCLLVSEYLALCCGPKYKKFLEGFFFL